MPAYLRVVLYSAILFGIALRLWNAFDAPALWLDEVFSAKLAESPLVDLLLSVPRYDTHPPLYYLQLHVWALAGQGDLWLILNSVLLDALVILSLLVAVGRIYGREAGLWAAAIYAVMPITVFFAENLRMYPQHFLLLVWLWYLLERRVMDGGASGVRRLGTLALGVALSLTHGLGFFVAFFVYLQAFMRIHSAHAWAAGRRPAALVLLDYIPVALMAVYPLGIGSFRRTEGMEVFDLAALGEHLTINLFGMEAPFAALAGFVGTIAILALALSGARSRPVALWLVILPFATLLLISLTVKSVFMYRTLALFAPFVAISLGLFFADSWQGRAHWSRLAAAILLPVLALAALNSSAGFRKEGYGEIAAFWDREAAPDALLVVASTPDLWGVSRYLPGAPAYSALEIQPPVRDGMARVQARLQGSALDRAGLFGRADHLTLGAREVWPYTEPGRLAGLASYWVLSRDGAICLRDGDRVLRSHPLSGQTLFECGA